MLKSFKHGEKVTIVKIHCEKNIDYLIPADVIQLGPSCNVENYDVKFYFKRGNRFKEKIRSMCNIDVMTRI